MPGDGFGVCEGMLLLGMFKCPTVSQYHRLIQTNNPRLIIMDYVVRVFYTVFPYSCRIL